MRLEISSSAFPKYDRNLNTGEALGMTARMQLAEQKIYHDREHVSYVVLPIVSPKP
jgi:predicted acyl esterase